MRAVTMRLTYSGVFGLPVSCAQRLPGGLGPLLEREICIDVDADLSSFPAHLDGHGLDAGRQPPVPDPDDVVPAHLKPS